MKGIDVIVEQAGARYQIAVVKVLGQIDTTTSHELERRLQYLLKDGQFDIIIDLSKVTYISSAGWGIFISEIRGIRESGGDLKLVGMTPEVAEVFEFLEFHNILESFKTVEAAVERFEKPKPSVDQEKHKSDASGESTEPIGEGEQGAGTEAGAGARAGVGVRATHTTVTDATHLGKTGVRPDSGTGSGSHADIAADWKNAQGTVKSARTDASSLNNEYASGGSKKQGRRPQPTEARRDLRGRGFGRNPLCPSFRKSRVETQ